MINHISKTYQINLHFPFLSLWEWTGQHYQAGHIHVATGLTPESHSPSTC